MSETKTYSQRLVQFFKDSGNESFEMKDIEDLVKAFGKLEFERRKIDADKMPFGKYKGKLLSKVAFFDPQYLEWVSKQDSVAKYKGLAEELAKVLQ